jgi:protein phosphatase 2C family protein 2/3
MPTSLTGCVLFIFIIFATTPINTTQIEIVDITEEDEFILLACDGLFDVMSNQEAVDFVKTEMARHGDAQRTAEALTRTATEELGSRDNVSVVVVFVKDL